MNRIPALLILISISLIGFTSCQKEITSDDSNPISNDSTYLDKIYDLYDIGGGLDTQYVYTFNYDNLHRLTSITSLLIPNDNVNWYYYYNGNDTLPYKSVYRDEHNFGIDTQTVYHYYDANQVKIKDSLINSSSGLAFPETQIINYSYSAGKMYGEISYTTSSSTVNSRDTAILDVNNNIINNKDYIFNGSAYVLNRTSDFTYDNYINPFSKLNIFKAMNYFPNGETLFWEIMCRNNIITQSESTLPPNQFNFDLVFSYTYTQNGLPATSGTGSAPDLEKEIFTYKSL